MPNRILREGINSSPRVNHLSLGAEILYRRLMSVADDYGRFYASPAAIRGACWPTHPSPPSEADINIWLMECAQVADKCPQIGSNLLTLYEVNGCKYLELVDFNQRTRSPSKFPEPCAHSADKCPQSAVTTRARTSPSTTDEIRQTPADGARKLRVVDGAAFRRWLEPWPRCGKPDEAARTWVAMINSPEDEAGAFAARDRYLASDEVARGVVTEPCKFLLEQARGKWAGKWPAAEKKQQARKPVPPPNLPREPTPEEREAERLYWEEAEKEMGIQRG